MRRSLVGLSWFLLVLAPAGCGDEKSEVTFATVVKAVQWPQADALFHRDPRWLGSDAAFSVPLRDGRILWLFNDTLGWVHARSDGFGATTIVVSFAPRIEGPWSKPRFVFRPPESNRPDANVYAAKGHPS